MGSAPGVLPVGLEVQLRCGCMPWNHIRKITTNTDPELGGTRAEQQKYGSSTAQVVFKREMSGWNEIRVMEAGG